MAGAAAAGRAIGIIQAYVSGVESGRVELPARRLAQIVEAYEFEPDDWQEILTFIDIIDQSVRVTDYVITFAETRELALSSDESIDLIRRIAKEMT